MKIERWAAAIFIFHAALGMAFAAKAGELRVIDGTWASSPCIGSFATPTCLIDTIIACDLLIHYPKNHPNVGTSLRTTCESIGSPGHWRSFGAGPAHRFVRYGYRIETWAIEDKDIPDWAMPGHDHAIWREIHWEAGDLAADVFMHNCRPHRACLEESRRNPDLDLGRACPRDDCYDSSFPTTFILRQVADRWRVVDSYDPVDHGTRLFYWKR